jgi:uncharacterized protein with HEPN domain
MSRDSASIMDICTAGQNIISFTKGLTRQGLEQDEMRLSAVLYQIMIIGEATKRLSQEFRTEHPKVPWSDMARMRDFVTHHYDRTDFEILWGVVQSNIPELLEMITPLLPQE